METETVAPHTDMAGLLKAGSGSWLGSRIAQDKTEFRLFAPRARAVRVIFFQNLDESDSQTLELSPMDGGVWSGTHPKNLHRWYYYFNVESDSHGPFSEFEGSFRILDPYALAAVGPAGPGIVWDESEIATVRRKFKAPEWHDLVVLEVHIRDLIRHAPIAIEDDERRGFTGFVKWLKSEGCYLKSLGVNAVELQPVQEFGDSYDKSEYHWGYMPVNYFCPESSYALNPEQGTQIEEFQNLVSALHDEGIAVILDVVYNHVGLPNHLLRIDKYYYFDVDDDGELVNWSGCGNTLRCDTPMGRRLIIDSLTHLIETYDIDGFRFDLAELMGIDVLRDIEVALKKVKPSVILIAEPWSFRGHIALALKTTGFAYWNDGYREFIYDYLMGRGNQEGLQYYMGGSLAHLTSWPAQSVNYVESHDDHSWIDKITENPEHRGDNPTRNDRRRTHLLVSIMMCSLGIPMLSAGQDTLRSKRGIHNTYRDAEVNAINYHRLLAFSGSHEYFARWIRFRRSRRGNAFRLQSPPSSSFLRFFGARDSSAAAILYNADRSQGLKALLFAVNPHHETAKIPLDKIELDRWRQLADHERFDEDGLQIARFHFHPGVLELPPLTCGLWEEE